MLLKVIVTEGTKADRKEACALIDGLSAEALLVDHGYDTDEIVEAAIKAALTPVIPSKKNRKTQCDYDKYIYKLRHLVENAFFTPQVVAWNYDTLRKTKQFFSCGSSNQMYSLWSKII